MRIVDFGKYHSPKIPIPHYLHYTLWSLQFQHVAFWYIQCSGTLSKEDEQDRALPLSPIPGDIKVWITSGDIPIYRQSRFAS